MVNSNVIRGAGLIILALVYVAVDRTFNNDVVNIAKSTHVALIGNGRGSMYNTCNEASKTLNKLTSTNIAQKPATDLAYNFYSINNPKEYLTGSDALLVEYGPYKLRKYSVTYDIVKTTSAFTTASDPDPNGSLGYSIANAYIVLDRDVTATSNLKRNDDLSLSFTGTKVKLPIVKQSLASHLSMKDRVVNFSPEYLSLLGFVNDEVNLVLRMHCTSDQIANIGVADKKQCTNSELGVITADCACCMLDDDYQMTTSRNTGSPPDFINCNSYFDEEGRVISLMSLLASHDGGVAVKATGEKKYDGSGLNFSTTAYGQSAIHTALIQSHTINDLMFGFPSAYLGRIAFLVQREQAQAASPSSLSMAEISQRMLTGRMDNILSFKLGDIAEYTSKVGLVCFSTCTLANGCSGYAPERHEFSDVDKIKLGGIDCKPYTTTFETVTKCRAINAALQLNPSAAGFEMCTCANGSEEWSTQGCCLASGRDGTNDLAGEGCLYEVAGVVDPNYTGMDKSTANAVDLGTALQYWIEKEKSESSSAFMCPAAGKALAEHEKFGQYETYGGSDTHLTFYHTGNDRMLQDDVTNPAAVEHFSKVSGLSGKYFKPKGLTVKVGTVHVTDAVPATAFSVYIPTAKRPISFVFDGVRDRFSRNKICGTDTCILSARLRPNSTAFNFKEDGTDGVGLPFNGLQPIGHVKGPSTTGRPEYFHQPLYFDGDEALYTQQDNAHVQRSSGNGVKIYRPLTDADPGTFDSDSSLSSYQLVDKAYVDTQKDKILSHIDMEVASGLGARQRMRFGTSYSIWECDPLTNKRCQYALNSKGLNDCYTTSGSNLFNSRPTNDKNDLKTLGRANFTYPCSAANFLTPKVVSGKITPMFWHEESTMHATPEEIDFIAKYAETYSNSGLMFITVVSLAFITTFLGVSMLLLCLCFEQKHSFMEAEVAVVR